MLEGLGRKRTSSPNDEFIVLESNARSVLEEGLEIRFRDFDLQVAKGRSPQLLRVKRRQREPPEMGAKKGASLPGALVRQVKFTPPVWIDENRG